MLRTLALGAYFSAISSLSFAAESVTLRLQHFVSPQSANPKYFIEPWAKKVEEESQGRLKIEIFPFMQLGGSAAEQYDMIRDGVIDGGWYIPGYQPNRFPEAEALELPFMTTKSAEEASIAAWRYSQKYLMDDFADVHVFAIHMHGPGLVHKRGAAIESVDDFAGLKLRGPSRPAVKLLEKLGATPIGMPVPAFPEALAKGVVDGGVITWEMSPSLKLDELTDSHTDVHGNRAFYNLYFIWALNKDVYEGLDTDLKAVLDANSGEFASAWAGRAHDTGDQVGRDLMDEAGNDLAQMSRFATEEIKRLGQEVTRDWINEMNAKGLDGQAMVQDARAFVEEAMTK